MACLRVVLLAVLVADAIASCPAWVFTPKNFGIISNGSFSLVVNRGDLETNITTCTPSNSLLFDPNTINNASAATTAVSAFSGFYGTTHIEFSVTLGNCTVTDKLYVHVVPTSSEVDGKVWPECTEGVQNTKYQALSSGVGPVQVSLSFPEGYTCPTGFQLVGNECVNIDECRTGSVCGTSQSCVDTQGSFTCQAAYYMSGVGLNQLGVLATGTKHTSHYEAVPIVDSPTVLDACAGHDYIIWRTASGFFGTGNSLRGQLGTGNGFTATTPVPAFDDTSSGRAPANVSEFFCGASHAVFKYLDGVVVTFGDNTYGQLGVNPSTLSFRATPQTLNFTSPATITVADGTTYWTTATGDAYGIGRNDKGQLGFFGGSPSYTAIHIIGPTSGGAHTTSPGVAVAQIASSAFTALFLLSDGTVWYTGESSKGEACTYFSTYMPSQVNTLSSVTAMASGLYHSFFLSSGIVLGCGVYADGQVPLNGSTGYNIFVTGSTGVTQVPLPFSGIAGLAACQQHSWFLSPDHVLYNSGASPTGALGKYVAAQTEATRSDVVTGTRKVVCGADFSVFLHKTPLYSGL